MIEDILSRLEKVKRTGPGSWLACCPAHEDRSPSLTLTEGREGGVVVKCFAECNFNEIVDAVGLGLEPWFPAKLTEDFHPPIRKPFPASAVLEALHAESLVVAVSAISLANGETLTPEDLARLKVAAERIAHAREVALG